MSAASEQNFQAPPPPPMPEAKPRAPRPTKLRPVAIGIIVLGLIVLIGGFANFIPGGKSTGAAVCFLGIVILAFSSFEMGHPVFASPAALSNASLLAPGTWAFTSR